MQVEAVELFHVRMPMKEVWRTAFSEESDIESIFVRMVVDGQEGWGETAPYRSPQYSAEWCDGAFGVLRDWLAPALIGQEIASGAALAAQLACFKGNPFAKAGLDLAWWDARARLEGQPLWRLIGGVDNHVEVGADIAVLADIDALIVEVGKAQDAGFKRTKLKFRPGWDVGMVRAVRGAFPDAVIHVDCNSGFTLDDLPLFRELDRFGLAMIEQPLAHDDLLDHARLQAELDTPICLDESIISLDRARKAIEIGACGWINLKVGRAGGLTNAIAIHDFCQEHDIPCWVGGMLESAVGQGPSLALSTLGNIRYPCDIFPSDRFYHEDLSEPSIRLAGPSSILAPETPGHGFAPDPDRLRARTIRHAAVGRER